MHARQISKLVEKINNQIKDKKGKLAPLIKDLRQVRTEFSQLESEYNEKKSLYESTGALYICVCIYIYIYIYIYI